LAIGIHDKLREAFDEEELSNSDLSMFLAHWTRCQPYQDALVRGDRRVNFDGRDAGPAFAPQPQVAEW
jgi:sRNA-binding protein